LFASSSSHVLILCYSYLLCYYQSTASAPHPEATQTFCRTRHTGGGSCCAGPPVDCRSAGMVCRAAHRSFAQPPLPVLFDPRFFAKKNGHGVHTSSLSS